MPRTFFLGAGFAHSFDQSFPLTRDLLKLAKAHSLFPENKYGELLTDYIDSYFGQDWTDVNFERVATFLHESPLSISGEPIETYSVLYQILIQVVTASLRHRNAMASLVTKKHANAATVFAFAEHITKTVSHVITTNYDLILDNALLQTGKWSPGTGYGPLLNPIPHITGNLEPGVLRTKYYAQQHVKLLKLHGSLNWGVPIHQPPWKVDACFLNLPTKLSQNGPEWFDAVETTFFTSDAFSVPWPYRAFIVPPVFGKALDLDVTRDTWFRATHRLAHSTEVIIIGYSFPESDMLAERMLRASKGPGFMNEPTKFTIVNKLLDPSMKARAAEILKGADIEWKEQDAMEYLKQLCAVPSA